MYIYTFENWGEIHMTLENLNVKSKTKNSSKKTGMKLHNQSWVWQKILRYKIKSASHKS